MKYDLLFSNRKEGKLLAGSWTICFDLKKNSFFGRSYNLKKKLKVKIIYNGPIEAPVKKNQNIAKLCFKIKKSKFFNNSYARV